MITVFNVGQGDSILLKPNFNCYCSDVPLLIDCGSDSQQVFTKINDDIIDVLITHSHNDHLGGFKGLSSKVRYLFIPYYLPEIWNIYNYLSKHLFNNVIDVDLINNSFEKVIVIGEGDKLCIHSEVLNPPKWPETYYNSSERDGYNIEEALRILRNNGIQLPEEEIINYRTEIELVSNLMFFSSGNNEQTNINEYVEFARNYVHNFFISLSMSLIYNRRLKINTLITKKFQSLIHRTSIVFKYDYHYNGKVLFTGDADKFVFNRLISKGTDISAEYLKVPHHGSKRNLSKKHLQKINPKYAIFSHNNGLFGRATDPHPNKEILDLFDNLNIEMGFTNDVIKGGPTRYFATTGLQHGFIDFKQP